MVFTELLQACVRGKSGNQALPSTTSCSSIGTMDLKAFKVQCSSRNIRVGITGRKLTDIIKKGKEKLRIHAADEVTVVLEDDGAIIDSDDFLQTLPSHTVLVFLREGESWKGVGDLVYDALQKFNNADKKSVIVEQIRELMSANCGKDQSLMNQYLHMLSTDVVSELRADHEDWFEGLNKKYKSKSEVMRNNAQARIRSYLTKAKEQIEKEKDVKAKIALQKLIGEVHSHLKSCEFHGSYFDRCAAQGSRMCDDSGWFQCEGAFDEAKCSKHHNINPYGSKENRQLFSLWNLDHIIEKSRVVIPMVIEAAKNKPSNSKLSCKELHKLLFTRDNLKLVQLFCHKKAARSTHTVSPECFYIS